MTNSSSHNTSKENCKTQSTLNIHSVDSATWSNFFSNQMIYITMKPSMNFTIECIIDDYLQWGLKLGTKKLISISIRKVQEYRHRGRQNPRVPSRLILIFFFFSFSEFSLCYELFKCPTWIIECPTDTGTTFEGQKGPLQSLSLIYLVMHVIVIPLSSHWSYQSFPLCPHTNAQHILLHTAIPQFPGNYI